jgi:hypothetical protein
MHTNTQHHAAFKRSTALAAGARLCSAVLRSGDDGASALASRNALPPARGAPAHDERKRDTQLPAQQLLLQYALQHAREDEAANNRKPLANAAEALGDLAHHDAAERL